MVCICFSGHHILLRGARRKCDVLHGKRCHKEHRSLPAPLVAGDDGPGPELGERTRSRLSSHGRQERSVLCLTGFRPVWLLKKNVFWCLLFRRQKWFFNEQFLRSCILYKSEFYFFILLEICMHWELHFCLNYVENSSSEEKRDMCNFLRRSWDFCLSYVG